MRKYFFYFLGFVGLILSWTLVAQIFAMLTSFDPDLGRPHIVGMAVWAASILLVALSA
jgi:hypothetical protein